VSELIPYRGLGCQGSAPYASPMPFVKQRRRGWLGRAAVSEHGAERPSQRGSADAASCGAPGACLRVTSGPPFHHAAMVLPAQTRGKAACRGHCVMGCAQP